MGNLVFQATLGGQVNLVGPNTASTYNLNVPTVNATLATTDANTFTAAQTISSGNLIFSGTSQKITGDYSNATLTSRAAFQSSTSNGSTGIYALPNGTSTAASWQATNAADPTNASKVLIATNGSTDVQLVSGRNGSGTYLPLTFYTNGSEQMRLDTSGNLGLGVTPSAWSQGNAFEIDAVGNSIFGNGANDIWFTANASFNSTWKYASTATAAAYRINAGAHEWRTAGSGTAGNAITFTQAMTLDANGTLILGSTSPLATSAGNRGQISLNGSSNTLINLGIGGTWTGFTYADSTTINFGSITSIPLTFHTGNTERARIDSSGNLLVSGTSGGTGHFRVIANGGDAYSNGGGICMVASTGNYWNLSVAGSGNNSLYFGYGASDRGNINYTTGIYTALSDRNKKKDFEDSPIGLAEVLQLKPTLFRMNEEESDAQKHLGFIAQDVQTLIPQAYVEQQGADGTNFIGLQDRPIIAALTKAIQELNAKVDAQAAEIAALKG